MVKKIILVIFLILLILLLILVIVFNRSNNFVKNNNPQKLLPTLSPTPTISIFNIKKNRILVNNKDNIISVYRCIQSIRDDRGVYSGNRSCEKLSNSCKQLNNINTQGPSQIWVNYFIGKTYQDFYDNSINLLKKDLISYQEIAPNQQNMHWNCPFFIDVYKNNASDDIKDMVKRQCLNVIMPGTFESFLDTEINNKNYDQQNIIDLIINPILLNQHETTNFERLSLFSTEYAKRYAFTQDNKDRLRSLYSTALTLSKYKSENPQIYLSNKCYMGQGLISAYELTKDERILDLAEEVYIKQNVSNIAVSQAKTRFEDKAVCLYFVRSLIDFGEKLNNNILYKELNGIYETTVNSLFSEYQDLTGKSSYFNGDGCFNTSEENNVLVKSNLLNALVLGTILK